MRKKTWLWVLVGLIVVAGVAGGFYYWRQQVNTLQQQQLTQTEKRVDQQLTQLYTDSKLGYFKRTTTATQLTAIAKNLDKLSQSDQQATLQDRYTQAKTAFELQTTLNAAFQKPVLEGDQLHSDRLIKHTMTESKFQAMRDKLGAVEREDVWHQNMATLITLGEKQAQLNATAKHAIAQLYVTGVVKTPVDETDYEQAQVDLAALVDETYRQELQAKLTPVTTAYQQQRQTDQDKLATDRQKAEAEADKKIADDVSSAEAKRSSEKAAADRSSRASSSSSSSSSNSSSRDASSSSQDD